MGHRQQGLLWERYCINAFAVQNVSGITKIVT